MQLGSSARRRPARSARRRHRPPLGMAVVAVTTPWPRMVTRTRRRRPLRRQRLPQLRTQARHQELLCIHHLPMQDGHGAVGDHLKAQHALLKGEFLQVPDTTLAPELDIVEVQSTKRWQRGHFLSQSSLVQEQSHGCQAKLNPGWMSVLLNEICLNELY